MIVEASQLLTTVVSAHAQTKIVTIASKTLII